MITILFILIFSAIIIFSIRLKINNEKKKFPKKSDSENEKNTKDFTSNLTFIWIMGLVIGILLINILYQSPEEKKIESKKLEMANKQQVLQDNIAKVIYAKKHRPVTEKLDDLYKDMHTNKDPNISAAMWFNSFAALYEEAVKSDYKKRYVKTKDSLDNLQSLVQYKIESAERKKYGEDLRNIFLDKGLNIKVSVLGKDNKKLKLTYALFDEVWFRRFQNEGYFTRFNDQGFTYIELTDGYDYGQYLKY